METNSKNRIDTISNGILLIGLGLLFYFNYWWPGILAIIWAALAFKQFLTGRYQDLFVTTLVLGGAFLISYFPINWNLAIPALFVVGGVYIIAKEFFGCCRDSKGCCGPDDDDDSCCKR